MAVIFCETSNPTKWVIDQPPTVRITGQHRPDRGTIGGSRADRDYRTSASHPAAVRGYTSTPWNIPIAGHVSGQPGPVRLGPCRVNFSGLEFESGAEATDAKACDVAPAPTPPKFSLIFGRHRTGLTPVGWTHVRGVYFRCSLFQIYWIKFIGPCKMCWNTKMFVRRRNPNCFLALILNLLLVAPALGKARTAGRDQQAADRDQDLCAHSLANPDAGIPACTRLIDREGNGKKSSGFYNNRGKYIMDPMLVIPTLCGNNGARYCSRVWGVGKVRKGDLESAIRDSTSALDHNPNFVDALKNRGIAFHLLGKYDDAIADFNQALQIDTKAAAIYNARGAALFQKGGVNRAIADYNKAIEPIATIRTPMSIGGRPMFQKRNLVSPSPISMPSSNLLRTIHAVTSTAAMR